MRRWLIAGAVALSCSVALPAVAGAAPVGRSKVVKASVSPAIFFWGSVSAVISGPGSVPMRLMQRPSRIFLTNDGADVLINLHWSSWGGKTATAHGTDSASNGVPNIAQGKRSKRPATVVLSSSGVFQGRRVYRCFTLNIPSRSYSEHLCLKKLNRLVFFSS